MTTIHINLMRGLFKIITSNIFVFTKVHFLVVDSYICKVRELEPNTDTDKINDLLSETAGFCGCILLKM